LGNVTALELLAGLDAIAPTNFLDVRERIELAHRLSGGRVLEDPRFLLCTEILRVPFPANECPPFAHVISKHMDVIRRADSFEQLLKTGVPYKGRWARLDTTSILTEVMAGPKREWRAAAERMADQKYPAWCALFEQKAEGCHLRCARNLTPYLNGAHSAPFS